MTTSTTTPLVSSGALSVPEALMPFLHNGDGQAFQSARPQALTACAEIAELVVRGLVRLDDDRLVVTGQADAAAGRPTWTTEVTRELTERGATVKQWVRRRRAALEVQREEAVTRGLLVPGRGRLLGLVPYPRHDVPAGTVETLAHDLAGAAATTERGRAVARLVVRSGLHRRHGLDTAVREALEAVSQQAGEVPHPALDAIDVAIGITVLGVVTGGE
ncbi:hypothetical protein [Nocardioides nanhaiensis]|uniref:GPP34 family phosphoprotein n=1 Tax=Nocardioides nanhaiensis TaxID=1476871 RepID=A0ABP8VQZ6_9ACTN